jgi:hypothetical protein
MPHRVSAVILLGGWHILTCQKPSWVAHPLALVFKGCGFRVSPCEWIASSPTADASRNPAAENPGTDGTFPDIFILGFP